MKIVETGSLCSKGVDMGSAHHRMSITPQPICPVLIGDKNDEIRTLCHSSTVSLLFGSKPKVHYAKMTPTISMFAPAAFMPLGGAVMKPITGVRINIML